MCPSLTQSYIDPGSSPRTFVVLTGSALAKLRQTLDPTPHDPYRIVTNDDSLLFTRLLRHFTNHDQQPDQSRGNHLQSYTPSGLDIIHELDAG